MDLFLYDSLLSIDVLKLLLRSCVALGKVSPILKGWSTWSLFECLQRRSHDGVPSDQASATSDLDIISPRTMATSNLSEEGGVPGGESRNP
jgi:hypothetical protein